MNILELKLAKIRYALYTSDDPSKLIINRNQMSTGAKVGWLRRAENSLVILLIQRSEHMTSFPHGEHRHTTQVAVNGKYKVL